MQNGEVKNLTIQGSVETNAKKNTLGGIVGVINNSTIDNCINEVTVTNKTGDYSVGGIAGWSGGDATIKNSINKANVTGGHQTGGIIAANQGIKLTIENCKNYGTITNEAGYAIAGIVGEDTSSATKTIIKNSTNYGEIKGTNTTDVTKSLGGLVGIILKELEIDNSNNEGKITIDSNSSFYVGGLVGRVEGVVNINNSHNKNTITSINQSSTNDKSKNVGGLIGAASSTQTSIITNSSNEKEGVISGGVRAGGLTGEFAAGLIINKCYNLANISTDTTGTYGTYIGGLVAYNSGYGPSHEDIVILNSYNKGNLNGSFDSNYSSNVGGLVGAQNTGSTEFNSKIINSYNQGNISSTHILSGIIRVVSKNVTLNNVYNVGLLNNTNINNNYIIGHKNTDATVNYKNVYYLNSLSGTLPEDTTNVIGKSADEMKNQSFVTLLNTNKNSINLTDIDSRLTGYTLCDWKLGTSGYPELDCK